MKKIFLIFLFSALPILAQISFVDTLSHYENNSWKVKLWKQYPLISVTAENVGTNTITLNIKAGTLFGGGNDTLWTIPPMRDSSWTIVSTLSVPVGGTPNVLILKPNIEILDLSFSSSAGDSLIFSVEGSTK